MHEPGEPLAGGMISEVVRLRRADGSTFVRKTARAAPPDLYPLEAEGLETLRASGAVRVPAVLHVSPDRLDLEDAGRPAGPGDVPFWTAVGRALAALHDVPVPAFGHGVDNYLGLLKLDNAPGRDGWTFFAETRMRFFLRQPRTQALLTVADLAAVERLADRLPELVPDQSPSLLHGDVWSANVVRAPNGGPVFLDPAVYGGWPEADLSMLAGCGGFHPVVFDAYREARPLADGWQDRLALLHVREYLSVISHVGDEIGSLPRLRALLARFV